MKGQITLTIQLVISCTALWQHEIPKLDVSHKLELFVIDKELDITYEIVDTCLDVVVDYTFVPDDLYAVEHEEHFAISLILICLVVDLFDICILLAPT